MSDDESESSNENYSLILNFQNIYKNTSSQILWTLIFSILLIVTVHQFFIIELVPLKDSLTPMTMISIPFMYTVPVVLMIITSEAARNAGCGSLLVGDDFKAKEYKPDSQAKDLTQLIPYIMNKFQHYE